MPRMTLKDFRDKINSIPHDLDSMEVVHLDYEHGYSIPAIFERKSDNPKDHQNLLVIAGGLYRE